MSDDPATLFVKQLCEDRGWTYVSHEYDPDRGQLIIRAYPQVEVHKVSVSTEVWDEGSVLGEAFAVRCVSCGRRRDDHQVRHPFAEPGSDRAETKDPKKAIVGQIAKEVMYLGVDRGKDPTPLVDQAFEAGRRQGKVDAAEAEKERLAKWR